MAVPIAAPTAAPSAAPTAAPRRAGATVARPMAEHPRRPADSLGKTAVICKGKKLWRGNRRDADMQRDKTMEGKQKRCEGKAKELQLRKEWR